MLNPVTLRRIRRQHHLTQQALGEAIGRNQSCISDFERGVKRHPTPATLAALAAALGVPMERLVQRTPRQGGQ